VSERGKSVANGIAGKWAPPAAAPGTGATRSEESWAHIGAPRVAPVPKPGVARVRAAVGADLVALTLAAFAAALASTAQGRGLLGMSRGGVPSLGDRTVLVALVTLAAWTMFVFYAIGLYRRPRQGISRSTLSEALQGFTALTTACWVGLVALYAITRSTESIGPVVVFWVVAVVAVPTARWVSRRLSRSDSALTERVLVVGAGEVGHLVAAKLRRRSDLQMEVAGFLDDGRPRKNGDGPSPPVLGALDDLAAVIRAQRITRVIVAFSQAHHQRFLDVVRTCTDADVPVNIVPRLFEVISPRADLDEIEGIPLLDVAHVELSPFNCAVKRVFDLIAGGLVCLAALPVIGVLALIVKLDSRGPVFYLQERMGRGGRVFHILKMRSMRVGAESMREQLTDANEYSGPMFKIKEDPRMTRGGRWMRRWSLDELPQILNVMKGDMSLVGPRPLLVEEARQCEGWARKRLDITPGITGLWQVSGRSDIPFDEMVKLDYMYVTGWSLSWDVKLLLQTLPAVLSKRGAY